MPKLRRRTRQRRPWADSTRLIPIRVGVNKPRYTFSMQCHYCQKTHTEGTVICDFCGMPAALSSTKVRQSRFIVCVIGLVIFCGLMILWLPRHIP